MKSPERRLLVDVSAFEAGPDRQVVLAACWTITDGGGRTALVSEQAVLAEPVAAMGDDGVVTAMTKAVDTLASRIAARISCRDDDGWTHISCGLADCIQKCFRRSQIGGSEALGEPAVDRLKSISRFLGATLIMQEAS